MAFELMTQFSCPVPSLCVGSTEAARNSRPSTGLCGRRQQPRASSSCPRTCGTLLKRRNWISITDGLPVLDIPPAPVRRMDDLHGRRTRSSLHRPEIRRHWPSLGTRLVRNFSDHQQRTLKSAIRPSPRDLIGRERPAAAFTRCRSLSYWPLAPRPLMRGYSSSRSSVSGPREFARHDKCSSAQERQHR